MNKADVTFIRGPRDDSPWRTAGRKELLQQAKRWQKQNCKWSQPIEVYKDWEKKIYHHQ
ncbi:hypothetical protein ACFO25_02155 [Paenactinomyces guangxiensis]|uniref:hypothetical protein n=1 Tax=Paenactinomyces guangxiensis TaxID=1490290 RepID=UPI0015EE3963|nr:hypothetical protein [Paenactinomyces guangxiensis]MBH8592116.1 hypothetical protein [Paenactinomyces guangxiensis]